MKASELIKQLAEQVLLFGDLEVVVHDGSDPSDLCHARGVSVLSSDEPVFEVLSGDYYVRPSLGRELPPNPNPIVEQIVKVLAANSPFLACLESKPFPKTDEIRIKNENQ